MSGPLAAMRVMLVDDNPHMRSIIIKILEGMGVSQLVQCGNGAAGLDMARSWRPDIAIVDFQMTPIDGVEFTYLIRNSPDSVDPYLPIIMLSGHSERARVFEARDAGVTEFLVKPVTPRGLIDRVNSVIFRPRPFVRTEDYHGPCRRRRQDPQFTGPWRRRDDSHMPEQLVG